MRFLKFGLLFLALASPAFAQDGPRASALAHNAAQALQAYAEGVAKSGGRPDYSKPPASDHLQRVFDAKTLAALPPSTAKDVAWLNEWLQSTAKAYLTILFFETKPGPDMDVQVVGRNATDYEDELAVGTGFILRLQARDVTAALLFWDTLAPAQRAEPTRQAGMQNVRHGALQSADGAITFMRGGVKPANARIIAAALRDTVAIWVPFTSESDRSRLLTGLAEARNATKDAEANESLSAVSSTIANYKG